MNQKKFLTGLVVSLLVVATAQAGVVGIWNMDEGAGTTITDSSGYGNNGTLQGSSAWVAGDTGGSDYGVGLTPGTLDAVTISNTNWDGQYWCTTPNTQFTITWDVKVKTAVDYLPGATAERGEGILMFTDIGAYSTDGSTATHVRGSHQLTYEIDGTVSVQVHGEGDADDLVSTATINDGLWHDIKVEWIMDTTGDGGAVEPIGNDVINLYIDGNLEFSNSGSGGDFTFQDIKTTADDNIPYWTEAGMMIGGLQNAGDPQYFDSFGGWVDDVVISSSLAPTIPEPATMSLLALGGIAMLKRRKK